MNRYAAIIDACVLGGGLKRNVILSLAEAGLFRPYWSRRPSLKPSCATVVVPVPKASHSDAALPCNWSAAFGRYFPRISSRAKAAPVAGDHGINGRTARLASAMAGAGRRVQRKASVATSPAKSRSPAVSGRPDRGTPWSAKASAKWARRVAVSGTRTAVSDGWAVRPSSSIHRATAAANCASARLSRSERKASVASRAIAGAPSKRWRCT